MFLAQILLAGYAVLVKQVAPTLFFAHREDLMMTSCIPFALLSAVVAAGWVPYPRLYATLYAWRLDFVLYGVVFALQGQVRHLGATVAAGSLSGPGLGCSWAAFVRAAVWDADEVSRAWDTYGLYARRIARAVHWLLNWSFWVSANCSRVGIIVTTCMRTVSPG